MATIQSRIESRVGEEVGGDLGFTTAMLQDAYTAGLKAVISPMPEEAWPFFGQSEISFNPTIGTPITLNKIISVVRRSGTIWRKCVEVDLDMWGSAQDLNSIHYRTPFTPAYVIDSGTYSNPVLKVAPAGNGDAAKVVLVGIPNVDITTDTIVPHFPDDLEELPEIYTAAWVKDREGAFRRGQSQDEIEAGVSILSNLTAMYTAISTSMGFIPALIQQGGTEIDGAKIKLDAIYTGGTDGMFDDFDSAITLVTTNTANAISILGSVSPVTNAVNAVLAGAAATTPVDTNAIGYLDDVLMEQAKTAIGLGIARVQEAGETVRAAASGITKASAELQNIDLHYKGVNEFITLAEAFFKEAQAHLTEVQGWLGVINSKLSETAVRIQTAGSYDQKSGLAERDGVRLQQKFDTRLAAYLVQFKKDPKQIFVRERRQSAR